MKNIHLIPTDKPSRLQLNVNTKRLILFNNIQSNNESAHLTTQNIYITSDEEIKEGDWFLHPFNTLHKAGGNLIDKDFRKIILTTDQDLIQDGVQAIDDEFLEWFVNNPSCEEVDIMTDSYTMNQFFELKLRPDIFKYKIIIPKEEPKQETLEQIDQNNPITRGSTALVYKQETLEEEPKQITSLDGDVLGGIPKGILTMLIGEKEETLKEAAEKYVNINVAKNAAKLMYKEHFIAGAKWQQERMHSDEEVFNLLMEFSSRDRNSSSGTPHSIAKWFEQFKKK